MIRHAGFSGFPRFLATTLSTVVAVVFAISCSDSTGPHMTPQPSSDGVVFVEFHYPDSIKNSLFAGSASRLAPTHGISANLVAPSEMSSSLAAALPTYTVSAIPFEPEAAPGVNVPKIGDDATIGGVPLGFTFAFFGQSFDKINIGTNGIVGFGPLKANGDPIDMTDGCCNARFINLKDVNNNIIALGWADWVPVSVKQIRYETRGSAPNRRFILQFTNVGENGGNGHITAQLVLYESTNEIRLYTTELSTTVVKRAFTQGIENLPATEAEYIAGRDSAKFSLANDGVKFTPVSPNKAPVITQPLNISVNSDASVCVANVSPVAPTVTDDAPGVTVAGVRSDNADVKAPYPTGTTTITWTATDVEGLKSSVTQTVTVSDKEKPAITAPQNITVRVNKGVSFASVDVGTATATDNCPDVKVNGTRNTDAPLNAGYATGVSTITWTATDAAGNTASATQTITVVGNQPPVVTAPPSLSVGTDQRECFALVNVGTATVRDDTDGATVVGVRNDGKELTASYPAYPNGVTTIRWTATDFDGLQATADQTITVSDNEKPSVTAPANKSVYNDPTHNYAVVATGAPSASDNCPNVTVRGERSDGQALGNAYPVGVTTIKWTATDAAGNYSSATQTITVTDNEAPHLAVPNDFEVNATSPGGATVAFADMLRATDNVGVVSVVCTPASGSVFPIGYSDIECVARDAAGNSTSGKFGVEVLSANEQIMNLIEYVQSLRLSNGVENPLVNQLKNAAKDNTVAQQCTKMDDFVHMVSVKNGSLSLEQSTSMIREARRIQAVLGCAGVSPVTGTRFSPIKTGVQFSRGQLR
jgi:hypothetical protein